MFFSSAVLEALQIYAPQILMVVSNSSFAIFDENGGQNENSDEGIQVWVKVPHKLVQKSFEGILSVL